MLSAPVCWGRPETVEAECRAAVGSLCEAHYSTGEADKEIQLAGSLQKPPALAKLSPAAALQQSLSSYLSVILLG